MAGTSWAQRYQARRRAPSRVGQHRNQPLYQRSRPYRRPGVVDELETKAVGEALLVLCEGRSAVLVEERDGCADADPPCSRMTASTSPAGVSADTTTAMSRSTPGQVLQTSHAQSLGHESLEGVQVDLGEDDVLGADAVLLAAGVGVAHRRGPPRCCPRSPRRRPPRLCDRGARRRRAASAARRRAGTRSGVRSAARAGPWPAATSIVCGSDGRA